MSTDFRFFVVDFYRMREAGDENDALPQAILYVYPTSERGKAEVDRNSSRRSFVEFLFPSVRQSMRRPDHADPFFPRFNVVLHCNDVDLRENEDHSSLLRSTQRGKNVETVFLLRLTSFCQFLSVPMDDWPMAKLTRHFQTLIDVFHLFCGTWNRIASLHSNETNDQIFDYLSRVFPPIIEQILDDHRTATSLFTVVDYVPLKKVRRTRRSFL